MFFPVFGDGTTIPAILGASAILWGFHLLVLRGVKQAAALNTIATIAKIVPLGIFVVVAIVGFRADIFALNFWGGRAPTFANVAGQVRNTLFVTWFAEYAFGLALKMTSAMTRIPYLLLAAYGLKLAWTRETYDAEPHERNKDVVVGALAAVYALAMIVAGGLKFVLLAALLYAPGTVLFRMARRQQGAPVFASSLEWAVFGLTAVAAAAHSRRRCARWRVCRYRQRAATMAGGRHRDADRGRRAGVGARYLTGAARGSGNGGSCTPGGRVDHSGPSRDLA